ncbi:hypothetical protein ACFIOZ_20105 [Vreelandella sp. F11]|uniref:hypothetical protein n=1 Tax=Vreelandella sp. F11 TaxID=3394751 RepID=UPI0036DD1B51
MSIELWLSFVLASFLVIASPGPAVALLVMTGINQGRKAALAMLPGFSWAIWWRCHFRLLA